MEEIIDQLVAQGYEVSGSNSSIRVKIGALTGKAIIRKNAYSNTFVVSTHTWTQLIALTLALFSILSSLFSQWGQPELSGAMWFSFSVGIPVVIMGFVSAIIAEIHLQPVCQIVRMANSKLSSPVA
ncbi:hypothetical protein ACPSLY_06915 [Vibrio parahaemolyticus]|uniref:hypothetical protein n=1 Tax=Vibrio parahaemolyticus TaxID=670 RepID=UPI00039DE81D|nr:hypothetical protein [Vibrio parahaemolyticus]AYO04183.1 hypothetical protein D0871_07715 [Vibrio parahaemolyticus]EGQ9444880.1 hypothetical protein [Vibrio parahaemolyticus]EGR3370919.1 hypothetical protein [Vibrio parahaemolyticus]EHZ2907543.1 hypothetical protein [Vibrio parahaemolyticus]EIF2693337.1 hypothetical protein [Vibrio parahaemolyticus]